MKHATLLFLLKDDQLLLAMKKRGFGMGRWNGVGGKIETNETIEQAAIRECQEEIGVTPLQLEKVAHHTFLLPTTAFYAHTYVSRKWEGEPIETEEMAPQWFHFTDIPYDEMWQDDILWLPRTLKDEKLVCTFHFDNEDRLLSQKIEQVDNNHPLMQ